MTTSKTNDGVNQKNSLFKYTGLDEYDFLNLEKQQLFLRTATRFNDPLDSAPFYSEEAFLAMIKDHINAYGMIMPKIANVENVSMEEKFKIFKRYFRYNFDSSIQDSALITCFSEDNQSNAMWAHYGSIYEGAIFEYDPNELLDSARDFLTSLKKQGLLRHPDAILRRAPMLEKVQYNFNRPDISTELIRIKELHKKCGEPLDYNDPKYAELILNDEDYKESLRKQFFSKTLEWSYEKEWRLVIPNFYPEKADPFTDAGKSLILHAKPKSIIMGYKIPQIKAKRLILICMHLGIPLFGSGPDYYSSKGRIIVEPLRIEFIEAMLK